MKADKGQISQVIANLTINAKESMPEGGVLYINAENIVMWILICRVILLNLLFVMKESASSQNIWIRYLIPISAPSRPAAGWDWQQPIVLLPDIMAGSVLNPT